MTGHDLSWILLHDVEGPVNLGGVCRAMANTGFRRLRFSGELTASHPEAAKFAVHAGDLLSDAKKCVNLESLIDGVDILFGFTPRSPWVDGRDLDLDGFHDAYGRARAQGLSIGLLFGNEARGLTNGDLAFCHHRIALPTCSDYASMNLAQAVMVVLWELNRKHEAFVRDDAPKPRTATARQKQDLIANLRQFLDEHAFLNPQNPERVWREIVPIFKTRSWTERELTILHAIFSKARARYRSLRKKRGSDKGEAEDRS